MTRHLRTIGWVVLPGLLVSAAIAACSSDSQSLGNNECPKLPLFRWEAKVLGDGGVTWARVGTDGDPLTSDQNQRLADAEKKGCITPASTVLASDGGP